MAIHARDDEKNETSKSLPQSCSKEMGTCLAEQPNNTLTSVCDAILVRSGSYLFIYPVSVIVLIPATSDIFLLLAANNTKLVL